MYCTPEPRKLFKRFSIVILTLFLCFYAEGCRPKATHSAPTQDSSMIWTSKRDCGGGHGLANAYYPMGGKEIDMANAINNYRGSLGLSVLNFAAGDGVGVARWHATDMNDHGYVGLVGSDGEDFAQRLACTLPAGHTPSHGGVIAVGQSDNVDATLEFLKSDPGANAVLTLTGNGIAWVAVGYDNGYFVIYIHK